MADKIVITEPGVYFGMAEDEYHADPSLSASGIKDLGVSPYTYWARSPLNPDQVDKASPAMATGKALHKRIIEGPEAFADCYATPLEKPDEAIDGGAELRARCGDLELKKSGTIAELCARIREADPDAVLWPEVTEEFKQANQGKVILKPEQVYDIEFPARIIEHHPTAAKAFTGGYPEVSIFWRDEETGTPLKARTDYLKTRAVVELKSFSNPLDKPLDTAIAHAIAYRRYYVDAAVRLEAAEQAKRLIGAAKGKRRVFGAGIPTDDWLESFRTCKDHSFVFVFLEQGDCPNVRVREFCRALSKGGTENLYWQKADATFRQAVDIWDQCYQHFGPSIPWIDSQPMTPFVDEEFPLWMND